MARSRPSGPDIVAFAWARYMEGSEVEVYYGPVRVSIAGIIKQYLRYQSETFTFGHSRR